MLLCGMNFFLRSLFLLVLSCCTHAFSQTLPVYDLAQLQDRVMKKNDTLYVVNFWATWCRPCVGELPYFEKAAHAFSSRPVKIILASIDAKSKAVQVEHFIKEHSYTSETFIFSAGNPNDWIDKIEPKWEGVIPATFLYKNGNKLYFKEGDYSDYPSLEKIIQSNLK
jgi:thiol-disulfide isomerase/thioredoxin